VAEEEEALAHRQRLQFAQQQQEQQERQQQERQQQQQERRRTHSQAHAEVSRHRGARLSGQDTDDTSDEDQDLDGEVREANTGTGSDGISLRNSPLRSGADQTGDIIRLLNEDYLDVVVDTAPTSVEERVRLRQLDLLGVLEPDELLERTAGTAALDSTSDAFDPLQYLCAVHADASFDELQQRREYVRRSVRDQDEPLKDLIAQHYHHFVACKETVDNLYRQIREVGDEESGGPDTNNLSSSLSRTTGLVHALYDPLLEKKLEHDRIRHISAVLKRFQFIFNLPTSIRAHMDAGENERVVQDYQKAISLIGDTRIPVFQKVLTPVNQLVEQFEQGLFSRLSNPHLKHDIRLQLIGLLEELQATQDPWMFSLRAQHMHLMNLLKPQAVPSADPVSVSKASQPERSHTSSPSTSSHSHGKAHTKKHRRTSSSVRSPTAKGGSTSIASSDSSSDTDAITDEPHTVQSTTASSEHIIKLCEVVKKDFTLYWQFAKLLLSNSTSTRSATTILQSGPQTPRDQRLTPSSPASRWNHTAQGKTCRTYVSEFFSKLGSRVASLLWLSARGKEESTTRFCLLKQTIAEVMNLHRVFHRALSIPEGFLAPFTLTIHQAAKIYVLSAWERSREVLAAKCEALRLPNGSQRAVSQWADSLVESLPLFVERVFSEVIVQLRPTVSYHSNFVVPFLEEALSSADSRRRTKTPHTLLTRPTVTALTAELTSSRNLKTRSQRHLVNSFFALVDGLHSIFENVLQESVLRDDQTLLQQQPTALPSQAGGRGSANKASQQLTSSDEELLILWQVIMQCQQDVLPHIFENFSVVWSVPFTDTLLTQNRQSCEAILLQLEHLIMNQYMQRKHFVLNRILHDGILSVWRRAQEMQALGKHANRLTQQDAMVLPFVKEVILSFVVVHAEVSRIMGSLSEQALPTVLERMTTTTATSVAHYVQRTLVGSEASRPLRLCLYNSLMFLNSSSRTYQLPEADLILQSVLDSLDVLPLDDHEERVLQEAQSIAASQGKMYASSLAPPQTSMLRAIG